MSSLPPELWRKVFHFVAFEDISKLRPVNSVFNKLALAELKRVDLVHFVDDEPREMFCSNVPDYMHPSPLVHYFGFKKFVVQLRGADHGAQITRALSFMQKRCSLRAIEFKGCIPFSLIAGLAAQLEYISANAILFEGPYEGSSVDKIMNLFPSLKAFDLDEPGPFCEHAWVKRGGQLVQWSSGCCGHFHWRGTNAIRDAVQCFKFEPSDQRSAVAIADLNQLKDERSIQVLRIEDSKPPPSLSLPQLKCFELTLDNRVMKMMTLERCIQHLGKLEHLTLKAQVAFDTSLAILSFIDSLPNLKFLKLTLSVQEPGDRVIPVKAFVNKTKLKMMFMQFDGTLEKEHTNLIRQIVASSPALTDFKICTSSSQLRVDRTTGRLALVGDNLLECNRFSLIVMDQQERIKHLHLLAHQCASGRDEVVALILHLINLESFYCSVDSPFVTCWLSKLTISDGRRRPHLYWCTGLQRNNPLTDATGKSILEAVRVGKLDGFTSARYNASSAMAALRRLTASRALDGSTSAHFNVPPAIGARIICCKGR